MAVPLEGAQTAPMASFNGSKFLRPNDLTIARAGVRIEGSGVPTMLASSALAPGRAALVVS